MADNHKSPDEKTLAQDIEYLEAILEQLRVSKKTFDPSNPSDRNNLQRLITFCRNIEVDSTIIEERLLTSSSNPEETEIKKVCEPLLLRVIELLTQIRRILEEND